jgi:hypothetical protein
MRWKLINTVGKEMSNPFPGLRHPTKGELYWSLIDAALRVARPVPAALKYLVCGACRKHVVDFIATLKGEHGPLSHLFACRGCKYRYNLFHTDVQWNPGDRTELLAADDSQVEPVYRLVEKIDGKRAYTALEPLEGVAKVFYYLRPYVLPKYLK